MITVRQKGEFSKLTSYLMKNKNGYTASDLDKFGLEGVAALASATPVDTGLTSKSWYYEIERTSGSAKITFCNSNVQRGIPIAIILQYGHGTRNGGYVQGRDYINPTLRPIFDKIAEKAWKEVTKL